MRVCIFVRNDFTLDARVLRQARSIAAAGHETMVVALGSSRAPEKETRDGFRVERVPPTLTWEDGIPRFTRLKRALLGPPRERPLAPPRTSTAAYGNESRSAGRPGRVGWILTGRGSAPRSWPGGGLDSLGGRVAFGVRLAARYPALRVRRAVRVASRSVTRRQIRTKRWLLRPGRFRQVERRMARAAIAFRPDVCWANDADTLRAAASAARSTGARLIYDSHEVIWDVPQLKRRWKWRWALVEATQIRRADAVSTVCDPIAELMARRYHISRPTVILNCPSLAESRAATPSSESPLNEYRRPGETIVLYPGNLAPYRGIEQVIDSMAYLPENVRFVILGHGAYRPVLEEYARKRRLSERVTFIQSVPSHEMLSWVAGADVGMVSHLRRGLNQEYVMPNKLFEFMHLGVPVVANDLPLVTPIVREVGFGEVVDITDERALTHAIAGLLEDPDRRAEMRERALEGARRYCWENEEGKVLALVEGRDHQKL